MTNLKIHCSPTVIDLFAGAGGLSSSLEATGWSSMAAVEIDIDAISTLRRNQANGHLADCKIIHSDIRDISAKDLWPRNTGKNTRPDLLAGGPPCQPFSSAGRMEGINDPRGQLFYEFVRLAEELNPRFILFENVAGIVTAKSPNGKVGGVLSTIQQEFENIGYSCRFDLLNAADFGAPQRRVRLYMIASRDEALPDFPLPTHSKEPSDSCLPWVTLEAFLSKRTSPSPKDIVRPSERRSKELSLLIPGTGLKSTGIVEANRPSGHWGYRQDCFLADVTLPSRTIRAASTPDWIKVKSGELRRLTWSECAGLQGFRSDWEFAGRTASVFRQIGNAVQGHIGRAIGEVLFESARLKRSAKPRSAAWPATFHKRVRYTAMEEVVNGEHRRAARDRTNGIIAPTLDQ